MIRRFLRLFLYVRQLEAYTDVQLDDLLAARARVIRLRDEVAALRRELTIAKRGAR